MRIDVHNIQRESLFEVEVDSAQKPGVIQGGGREVHLRWEQALDDEGYLRSCPVCECRELFVRRDFPQATGMILVVGAVVTSLALFGMGYVWASWVVLGVMVVVDAGILHLMTGRCLVCYRCRSEFRDLPIDKNHDGWDLATGEKYRPVNVGITSDSSDSSDTAGGK